MTIRGDREELGYALDESPNDDGEHGGTVTLTGRNHDRGPALHCGRGHIGGMRLPRPRRCRGRSPTGRRSTAGHHHCRHGGPGIEEDDLASSPGRAEIGERHFDDSTIRPAIFPILVSYRRSEDRLPGSDVSQRHPPGTGSNNPAGTRRSRVFQSPISAPARISSEANGCSTDGCRSKFDPQRAEDDETCCQPASPGRCLQPEHPSKVRVPGGRRKRDGCSVAGGGREWARHR